MASWINNNTSSQAQRNHSFFVGDLHQPTFWNWYSGDIELSDETMRLSYQPTGRPTLSWLCELTIKLPAVPYHDMVILVNTGNIDADRHTWTPMYNLCARCAIALPKGAMNGEAFRQ
jgi:hypothetical protein